MIKVTLNLQHMATKIYFSDLTHMGQIVAANTIPLGIAYVATYAKENIKDDIDVEIFKYPDDLSNYLDKDIPQLACFSNFSWNIKLSHEFAKRIKEFSPNTITVFGGPNFPDKAEEQQEFLKQYPAIDFYLEYEGEKCFVELYNELKKLNFDKEKFIKTKPLVHNIRYLDGDKIIRGALGDKFLHLEALPSPYLTGMLDKFFDDTLIPMMQSTRGCPFTCTFCWEGGSYFTKTPRYTQDRIVAELNYIAERVKTKDLQITDANFGMFPKDIDTAKSIKDIQNKFNGYPETVLTATAKTGKERTLEIVKILGTSLPATAAVQSTDAEVLTNIKRKNVSQDVLVDFSKGIEKEGGQSEAEIILCIEGDTKEKHIKTVTDMLDANMKFIRLYQFMMLPGTQSTTKETREKWQYTTRYRVLPRCFGTYRFRDHKFPIAEIEEICVAHKTMPYEDYQACRSFDLTVEIFNNDSILADLMNFLRLNNIKRSELILKIHELSLKHKTFSKFYDEFNKEEKDNLTDNPDVLEDFAKKPGIIEQYIDGTYGTNELYKFRAIAVFHHIKELHEIAYEAAKYILNKNNMFNEKVQNYLEELFDFSILRKSDCLNTNLKRNQIFHYDFKKLWDNNFDMDPFDVHIPKGIDISMSHSDNQIGLIRTYETQYGTSLIGLGRILLRANMDRLYLSVN